MQCVMDSFMIPHGGDLWKLCKLDAIIVHVSSRHMKGIPMDSAAATSLANQLSSGQKLICQSVAARLLQSYPELSDTLRLEEQYQATERLSEVAVERLSELVRSVLLFELPTIADSEFNWAHGLRPARA